MEWTGGGLALQLLLTNRLANRRTNTHTYTHATCKDTEVHSHVHVTPQMDLCTHAKAIFAYVCDAAWCRGEWVCAGEVVCGHLSEIKQLPLLNESSTS